MLPDTLLAALFFLYYISNVVMRESLHQACMSGLEFLSCGGYWPIAALKYTFQ